VPPIPHIEPPRSCSQLTNSAVNDYDEPDIKNSLEEIITPPLGRPVSGITKGVELGGNHHHAIVESMLPLTVVHLGENLKTEGSSSEANQLVTPLTSGFNLLSCQIFLYKGFEDAMHDRSRHPDQVYHYSDEM
jgi:hypothetical protein